MMPVVGLADFTAVELLAQVLPIVSPHEDDGFEEFGLRFDAERACRELARRAAICELPSTLSEARSPEELAVRGRL